jgi:hypothetical protein
MESPDCVSGRGFLLLLGLPQSGQQLVTASCCY